eukprot:c9387_g1_i6.p1 GENE.c9387_g1_i6~~c9387_g1_i6.p1  ORF type:complete len:249 (-),score=55.55 c9387_g1_i6:481-1227(-)
MAKRKDGTPLLGKSVSLSRAIEFLRSGSTADAIKCIDLVMILGAPEDVTYPFVEYFESSVSNLPRHVEHSLKFPPIELKAIAIEIAADRMIDRIHCPDIAVFRNDYYKKNKRVVVTGTTTSWTALSKWSDMNWFISNFGHRWVPVEIGSVADGTWREEVVTFKEFIETYLYPREIARENANSNQKLPPIAYLAQHDLLNHFPTLTNDIEIPSYCDVSGGADTINGWIGPAGTVTPFVTSIHMITCLCR